MQKSEKKEISFSEAKILLEEEKKQRVLSCEKEINEVLKKFNCTINVSMIVSQRGNLPNLSVEAL